LLKVFAFQDFPLATRLLSWNQHKPMPRIECHRNNKHHATLTSVTTTIAMLEVGQATIITAAAVDESDDDNFLDLTAFAAGATFSLSAWGPCPCDDDDENDQQEQQSMPLSWRRPPCENNDCWSDSSDDEEEDSSKRRVRFSLEENEIQIVERPTPQEWNRLYYSCHELQKIVDDYRLEQQEEQEWEEECSRHEGLRKQQGSPQSVTFVDGEHETTLTEDLGTTTTAMKPLGIKENMSQSSFTDKSIDAEEQKEMTAAKKRSSARHVTRVADV
jgi:hypothetical protein